jgi:plasmid stability protein
MGHLIILDLEDEVIERYRVRAKARGVSLEQELRDVLRHAAQPNKEELLRRMDECRAMTPALTPGVKRTSAEDIIREIRDTE